MADLQSASQNELLATLPADVRDRLFPHLERVRLSQGEILHEPGAPIHHVYFPTDAVLSLRYVMEDGTSPQIAVVGNDGLVGVPLFMGGDSTPSRAVVLCAGSAYRVAGPWLKDEFDRHGALTFLLLRYAQALITQVAQNAVCSRRHTINQQLCHWLLLALDRLPGATLNVTQEGIASMLGVRREGVAAAAGRLQKLGVIQYRHGTLTVLDRTLLEQLSCECHAALKAETARLLPYDVRLRGERRRGNRRHARPAAGQRSARRQGGAPGERRRAARGRRRQDALAALQLQKGIS